MEEQDSKFFELGSSQLAQNVVAEQILPDEAKSTSGSYDLPTGYIDDTGALHRTVVVKELTGVEEDILASRKMAVTQRMEMVLQNCTVSIGTVTAAGNPNWARIIKNLTVGDRLFLILKIRTVSIGAPFRFKTQCPGCQEIIDQVVSLDDFQIKGLADPMVRHWPGTLPRSKKTYVAKVQTGIEDEKISKLANSNDTLSMAIIARLIELGGKQPVSLADVKALSLADREYLRTDFNAHEGKIDSEVEVTCQKCDHEFKTAIDIGTPNFFFPSVT